MASAGDSLPSTTAAVQTHLAALAADPSTPIDARLLDDFELQLTESSSTTLLPLLLPLLTTTLFSTPHDPAPLTALLTRLARPLSFPDILEHTDPPALVAALASPAPAANLLALALLQKAASPAAAALLAALTPLVPALLDCWLTTPSVDVGAAAGALLQRILEADSPDGMRLRPAEPAELLGTAAEARRALQPVVNTPHPERGSGQVWRSIFGVHLAHVTQPCAGSTGDGTPLAPRQTSLAQDRVLRLLPTLCALNLRGAAALARLALVRMVDSTDVLMVECLAEAAADVVRWTQAGAAGVEEQEELARVLREAGQKYPRVQEELTGLPGRMVPEHREEMQRWVERLLGPV